MSDVIIVDNSILTSVATCPTAAALRYGLGLTVAEDSGPLKAGHMAHAILAAHLSGKAIDDCLADPEVADYVAWATGAITDGDRLAGDNVLKVMRRWIETHPVAGLPFRPVPELVEVGFGVPLADDVLFVGRMDALAQDASGAWYVIEHKTTGRLDEMWRKRYRTSGQITGYVWAAQQHLRAPVAGCFVNGIEFGRLPTDVKKCRTHGVPYAECGTLHARFDMLIEHRAPHQLEAWREDAVRLARRFASLRAQVADLADVRAIPTYGQLTGACINCQFADFCAVGRPVEVGRAMLRYEPWSPFAHAFGPSEAPA